MQTYYKATRPDGRDFRTGRVEYVVGSTIEHPRPHKRDASGYLSVATVPTDCTGASWPLRLFEVTADETWGDPAYPSKRCTHSLTVVRELDPLLALGPQGQAVVALIERCKTLTFGECSNMAAAWDAARDAARAAARAAARDAARAAAWDAAWDAARAAAGAAAWAAAGLLCRDLIGDTFTQEHYDTLTQAWRKVIGPIHPDDADLRTAVAR